MFWRKKLAIDIQNELREKGIETSLYMPNTCPFITCQLERYTYVSASPVYMEENSGWAIYGSGFIPTCVRKEEVVNAMETIICRQQKLEKA